MAISFYHVEPESSGPKNAISSDAFANGCVV